MKDLNKHIASFLSKYHDYDDRLVFSGSNSRKNQNFICFYYEVGKASNIPKADLDKFTQLLSILLKYIHGWDDLIDEEKISITTSYKVMLSGELLTSKDIAYLGKLFGDKFRNTFSLMPSPLTPNQRSRLIKKLGNERLAKLKKANKENIVEELTLVKSLGLDVEEYLRQGGKDLDTVQQYFFDEKNIKNIRATRCRVRQMLKKGNCDFYTYNNVFFELFSSKKAIEELDSFLKEYLPLDLLLDHITDVKEDIENGSFNVLLWWYETNMQNRYGPISKENFNRKLLISGAYDFLYDIGQEFGNRAKRALTKISNKELRKVLQYYLDGEVDGLKLFMKINCCDNMSHQGAELVKTLILKPHPWEMIDMNTFSLSQYLSDVRYQHQENYENHYTSSSF